MSMRRVSLGLVGGLLGSGLGGRLNRSFSGGGLLDRSLGSGGDLGGGLSFLDDSLLRAYRLVTSSMTAAGVESPLRGAILTMRV